MNSFSDCRLPEIIQNLHLIFVNNFTLANGKPVALTDHGINPRKFMLFFRLVWFMKIQVKFIFNLTLVLKVFSFIQKFSVAIVLACCHRNCFLNAWNDFNF